MMETLSKNTNKRAEKPNTSLEKDRKRLADLYFQKTNNPPTSTYSGFEAQVVKNKVDTSFYSENQEGELKQETDLLKGDLSEDNLLFAHDVLHPIIQAKFESLGVIPTKVVSLENEFMVVGASLNDLDIRDTYHLTNSGIVPAANNFVKDVVPLSIPDYNQNPEKYKELTDILKSIFIQSGQLGYIIYNHKNGEFFAKSINQAFNTMKQATEELKNPDELDQNNGFTDSQVHNFETNFSSSFDKELYDLCKKEVELLNNSILKLKGVKAKLGIDQS